MNKEKASNQGSGLKQWGKIGSKGFINNNNTPCKCGVKKKRRRQPGKLNNKIKI